MSLPLSIPPPPPSLLTPFQISPSLHRPTFLSYLTCGFPSVSEFPSILLSLQRGGSDIIEIGVPFTDPMADGPSIQRANQTALGNGVNSLQEVLLLVKKGRDIGVTVPIVLMGYYNPFRAFAETEGKKEENNTKNNNFTPIPNYDFLFSQCSLAGVSGFIIVDLPPEESILFRSKCQQYALSFIPLITPTTTDERIQTLCALADSFIYCVSLTGTTGAQSSVSAQLPALLTKIRKYSNKYIAVGFGIGNREQLLSVYKMGADGVVIGSAIINAVGSASEGKRAEAAEKFCREVTGMGTEKGKEEVGHHHHRQVEENKSTTSSSSSPSVSPSPSPSSSLSPPGYFGTFGGRFVPETLVSALDELEYHYNIAKNDPTFHAEVQSYWDYIGRPSRLHVAERLTEYAGGAKIWLKREDLNHTGAHKINNAIAQAILAKRLKKPRLIAETGAGQHGVASATICAKLGIPLTVYMGSEDVSRQQLNVFRMKLMGATVVSVDSGSKTLKDAINEAMRDWVSNIHNTHYLIGSAIGPHPFPTIVRDFQSVIGKETREQYMKMNNNTLPSAVIACVGGGSNAIGMFHPFINDSTVRLIGVEAAGEGITSENHSATLCKGTPGVLHGTKTYLLQDEKGQISSTHSISAGLDYPGVGPEHSYLKDIQRAEYVAVSDKECLIGFSMMAKMEGIIPALETSHAIYHAVQMAKGMRKEENIVICVSGRGDKDLDTVTKIMPVMFPDGVAF